MATPLGPLLEYMGSQFSDFFSNMGRVAQVYMTSGNLPETKPNNGLPTNGLATKMNGKGGKVKKRKVRDPDKPKRAPTLYNIFIRCGNTFKKLKKFSYYSSMCAGPTPCPCTGAWKRGIRLTQPSCPYL
jgi:hypothetical protein